VSIQRAALTLEFLHHITPASAPWLLLLLSCRVMATLGELLFYIATQQQDSGSASVQDTSIAWGITPATIAAVVRLLKPGEDEVCQHYAAKTIENICSQGGEWASKFAVQVCAAIHTQGEVHSLCVSECAYAWLPLCRCASASEESVSCAAAVYHNKPGHFLTHKLGAVCRYDASACLVAELCLLLPALNLSLPSLPGQVCDHNNLGRYITVTADADRILSTPWVSCVLTLVCLHADLYNGATPARC
jgi:hypothetical protein